MIRVSCFVLRSVYRDPCIVSCIVIRESCIARSLTWTTFFAYGRRGNLTGVLRDDNGQSTANQSRTESQIAVTQACSERGPVIDDSDKCSLFVFVLSIHLLTLFERLIVDRSIDNGVSRVMHAIT